jgi:RNA recognition motif-containing protein
MRGLLLEIITHIRVAFRVITQQRATFTRLSGFLLYLILQSLSLQHLLSPFTYQNQYMNIFVGNLGPRVTEDNLRQLFVPFGKIESINIITDFNSGLSRGFGFVEMAEKADGNTAVKKLDNVEFMNSILKVSEALPKVSDVEIAEKSADVNVTSAGFAGRKR